MKFRSSIVYIFAFTVQFITAQPNYPTNANDAELIAIDVKNFVEAINALSSDKDTLLVLQKMYFDKATIGLKEYIRRFNLSAESLSKAIHRYPETYKNIEKFYNEISTIESDYPGEMRRFKEVLPNAIFPPTYFIVGDYSGYANASKFGQLVSIEKSTENHEKLKNLIIHELTHFQQAMSMGIEKYSAVYSRTDNMLELILREGGAEFITYNLIRQNVEQFEKLKFYEKNEVEYWDRFNADVIEQDKTIWLKAPTIENRKKNLWFLGYCLGYKIVESYYNQSKNKAVAIEEILRMNNADQFLKISKYSPSD